MDRDKEEYVILVFFGYFSVILLNGIVCYTTVIHIFETTILFISAQLGGGLKKICGPFNPYILEIIQFDEHYFFKGVAQPPPLIL